MSLEKATLYETHRLPYPADLAEDLLKRTGAVAVVADIGAGTGQLARLFAKRSARVYAIEPDFAMRQVGSAALSSVPTVEFLAGSAGQTTLATNSVDLIVVGNAFHRFEPESSEEFRRTLRQSGWVAIITYDFTDQAFRDMLFSKLAALQGVATRINKSWRSMPIHSVFGQATIHTLSYHQSHLQDWPAFFGNACAGIEAPERNEQEFAHFEALNREVFETFAVDGRFQIMYETQVSFGQPFF